MNPETTKYLPWTQASSFGFKIVVGYLDIVHLGRLSHCHVPTIIATCGTPHYLGMQASGFTVGSSYAVDFFAANWYILYPS